MRASAAKRVGGEPVPFVDRWTDMSDAQKAEVADGHASELDALVAQLGSMGDDEREAAVRAAYVSLDAQVSRIESTRAHLDRLVAERNALFARLALLGESQGMLGRRARVSTMTVSFAIAASVPARKRATP